MLRARHINETKFVSAGDVQLAGFFDGLTPDPHWNLAKQVSQQWSGCQAGWPHGMLARVISLINGTVHAQGGCSSTPCTGDWTAITPVNCPTCSSGSQTDDDNDYYCNGWQLDGTTGCNRRRLQSGVQPYGLPKPQLYLR